MVRSSRTMTKREADTRAPGFFSAHGVEHEDDDS